VIRLVTKYEWSETLKSDYCYFVLNLNQLGENIYSYTGEGILNLLSRKNGDEPNDYIWDKFMTNEVWFEND